MKTIEVGLYNSVAHLDMRDKLVSPMIETFDVPADYERERKRMSDRMLELRRALVRIEERTRIEADVDPDYENICEYVNAVAQKALVMI